MGSYDTSIKTKEGEPRLLLVAVDVQDATTVTFDSYVKKHNQMMYIYGDDDKKRETCYTL